MSKNKNQPFSKVALICLGIFGVFAAFFAGFITLTSSASFVVVFGWIMGIVLALMVVTFFYGYVLAPSAAKDFIGYLLITGGLTAMFVAICLGLFAHTDVAVAGGLGLIAAVIGAAIVNDKQ
jgi:hypothetical protein